MIELVISPKLTKRKQKMDKKHTSRDLQSDHDHGHQDHYLLEFQRIS